MKTLIVALVMAIPFIGLSQQDTTIYIKKSAHKIILVLEAPDSVEMGAQKINIMRRPGHVVYAPIDTISDGYQVWRQSTYDTVRATLLITSDKMQIAHGYEGYVVTRWNVVTRYLDKRMLPLDSKINVWGYKINKRQ